MIGDMDTETHKKQVISFFDGVNPPIIPDLNKAIYTLSELRLWPDDVDAISKDQVLMCWKVVEILKAKRFPENLKM